MGLMEAMAKYSYEEVVYFYDRESGLKAIVAIHDTTLGPALGGIRMWPYSSEEDALNDVLRLSRGMTFKNAAAGLDHGGGKAVIIGDPHKDKTEELLRAYGRCVEKLGGKYITAEDVGINQSDIDLIRQETRFATGFSGGSGDPSPNTARGVWHGIRAAVKTRFGCDSLKGLTIAVQGIGNVGYNLCKFLEQEGANLIVADIKSDVVEKAVREFNAKAVSPEDITGVKCDVFAPCALGGVINSRTIPLLRCPIIAGSANNVLEDDLAGEELFRLNILYIPDFIINAGGVINVAEDVAEDGCNHERVLKKVDHIYDAVLEVLNLSRERGIPTFKAAELVAMNRINSAKAKG